MGLDPRMLGWGSIPECWAHALSRRQALNRCATQAPHFFFFFLHQKPSQQGSELSSFGFLSPARPLRAPPARPRPQPAPSQPGPAPLAFCGFSHPPCQCVTSPRLEEVYCARPERCAGSAGEASAALPRL